jgi:hypothetical protein
VCVSCGWVVVGMGFNNSSCAAPWPLITQLNLIFELGF